MLDTLVYHRNRLNDVKSKIDALPHKDTSYRYTDYEEYRKEIVYAFEQISFVFKDRPPIYLSENCDYFVNVHAPECKYYSKVSGYSNKELVMKKRNYLNNLRIKLGEVYLLKDERKRRNKMKVIHDKIANIYFTEIEKDPEVGYGRSDAELTAKALLPYKEFILEIVDAQKRIDRQEAEKFLKEFAYNRCIKTYKKWFGN